MVHSYTGSSKTLEATGTGSVLDLSNVATLTGSYMTLEATGNGSELRLPQVTLPSKTTVTADDGGSVSIAVGVLALPSSQAGATITIPQLPQGVTLNLASSESFTGGTTFNVPQGDTVNITGGTFTGGMDFNVDQDATISVGGGFSGSGELLVSGTLTGSGAGTVQFVGGIDIGLDVGLGGLTLDFPGNMFQWAGGTITTLSGNMLNAGNMYISGYCYLTGDGVFDDFGTIVETGYGNLGLHSDSQIPTELKIEPGASYLFENDSGVGNNGGQTEIENAGTIAKTAGTGTSTLLVNGTLSNTGIIEAGSGTLSLSGTIAQLSGTTLTAGTWVAESDSTLSFPSGTSITTNQANISLDGTGASIPAIAGLTSNSGSSQSHERRQLFDRRRLEQYRQPDDRRGQHALS